MALVPVTENRREIEGLRRGDARDCMRNSEEG
jgi:hypothetical protein